MNRLSLMSLFHKVVKLTVSLRFAPLPLLLVSLLSLLGLRIPLPSLIRPLGLTRSFPCRPLLQLIDLLCPCLNSKERRDSLFDELSWSYGFLWTRKSCWRHWTVNSSPLRLRSWTTDTERTSLYSPLDWFWFFLRHSVSKDWGWMHSPSLLDLYL